MSDSQIVQMVKTIADNHNLVVASTMGSIFTATGGAIGGLLGGRLGFMAGAGLGGMLAIALSNEQTVAEIIRELTPELLQKFVKAVKSFLVNGIAATIPVAIEMVLQSNPLQEKVLVVVKQFFQNNLSIPLA